MLYTVQLTRARDRERFGVVDGVVHNSSGRQMAGAVQHYFQTLGAPSRITEVDNTAPLRERIPWWAFDNDREDT